MKEKIVGDKCLGKFKFGLKNLFCGWTELFTEPCEAWKSDRSARNLTEGAAFGIFNAVADTAGGVLHVVTSPVPIDIPLPKGGTDNI